MTTVIAWIITALIFILLLGILVFVHEAGHFFAARLSGMKVEEFAFGFPPRIWGRKHKGTLYAINAIPLGGYVKILGEEENSERKDSFGNKSIAARIFVVVAGVLMNFVLAFIVMIVLFYMSFPPLVSTPESYGGKVLENSGGVIVDGIKEGSLAEKNGILAGDMIVQIGDVASPRVENIRNEVAKSQGGEVTVKIDRNGSEVIKNIEIGTNTILGVELSERISKVHYMWWKVPYYALIETAKVIWMTAVAIAVFLANLVVVHKVPSEVMGPVGIFGITFVAIKLGFGYVLNLLIALTVNLGLINILPFPALDGGRLVFLIVEKIRGKKVAINVESLVNNIGFFLLIALAILVTIRDVIKLF